MRIAYVCYWSVYRRDGVARKLETQVEEWRRAGHEVELLALSRRLAGREPVLAARPFLFGSGLDRVRAALRLLRALQRFRPDVVYLRYDLLPPPLQLLPRLYPTVVELNSDEHAEYVFRTRGARLADVFGRGNWRALFGRAAGVVSVTRDLLALVERYGRPSAVIANGIDLPEVEPLPAAPADARPTLLFSGTPGQRWHGVDKLLALAAARPELDVIVLGLEPTDDLPPNVEAHPFLPRERYEPLIARAHAALGTAALHRKRMREACPLKVREYLAYGLPVVLPYEDTDLVDVDDWWLLRLPNEEQNLVQHADAVVDFVRSVRDRRVERAVVAPLVGADAKEAARLAFLARVTG